ncbi:peptidoglycan/xylan/chitin deacetylase (PgdA/CDA1 family) [Spirosoma lacussanchae]|uniref:polysaccharide deacetylase family protein n=1 Tax=Spirosoma lacussanchae TaxID=1884249 RepID=UPI001109A503|nr:polysaccharide deacetylase family protein [Spirosoma lacussanchae]
MHRSFFFLLLAVSLASPLRAQKEICITIDDLPTVSSVYRTPGGKDSLTRRLLTQLRQYNVPALGFVVGQQLLTGGQVDQRQINLLTQWLNAGMELGNHTLAHKGYNAISAVAYQQDVLGGEAFVKPLVEQAGKRFRYFRHPFLHRGNSAGKQDSLRQFLSARGYQEAPVSIDNSDYLFSAAYDKALLRNDTALASRIGSEYVTYMVATVRYYEAQADSLFSRPIRHVLLTHANTINSFYLGKLLAQLQTDGYRFVSLDRVLEDEAYRSTDRYVGNAGISWIHRWALTQGKKGAFFAGEPEVPAYISALVDQR